MQTILILALGLALFGCEDGHVPDDQPRGADCYFLDQPPRLGVRVFDVQTWCYGDGRTAIDVVVLGEPELVSVDSVISREASAARLWGSQVVTTWSFIRPDTCSEPLEEVAIYTDDRCVVGWVR